MRLRIRRRAKKELLDIDDDVTFFAVVRAILDLEATPRPRGYDRVEGRDEVHRIWVGRDWRVLYSLDPERDAVIIGVLRPGAGMASDPAAPAPAGRAGASSCSSARAGRSRSPAGSSAGVTPSRSSGRHGSARG